jgi:hypothetical protein
MSGTPWYLDATRTFTGAIRFLSVAPEVGSPDIALVCFVRARIDALPTVLVERLLDGQVDKANGRLQISEVTDAGTSVLSTVSKGTAQFSPKTAGAIQRGYRIWEFLVRSAPGGAGVVTFRVSAGLPSAFPVSKLDETGPVTADAAMLNAATPPKVVFGTKTLPRLSEGVNKGQPEPAPDKYRGFSKGAGDPGRLASERTGANLSVLLHQVFFQLDAPHTFDAAWDVTAGSQSWVELSNSAFTVSPIVVAEERWARQVTEMLLLTVYRGPQLLYGAFDDFNLTAKSFLDASNPYFGLGHRCQDLATFGVTSRGTTIGKYQITAGSAAAATVVNATPAANWYVDEANPRVEVNPKTQKPAAQTGRPHDLMQGDLKMNLKPLIEQVPTYSAGAVHLFSNPRPVDGPITGSKTYQELIDAYNAGKPIEGKASVIGQQTIKIGGKDKTFPAQKTVVVSKVKGTLKPGDSGYTIDYPYLLLTDDQQFVRDNQGSAHIAFALRVRHDLKLVQFFDTGALNIGKNDTDLLSGSGGFHSGNYDSVGTTNIRSLSSPYKGTGVFPALDVSGGKQLWDRVKQLRRARPIGLARFAVLDRAKLAAVKANKPQAVVEPDGALIYASALLPMWGKEDEQNYPIGRFLWSLRALPSAANLQAVWMLYVPRGSYAEALASAGRGSNIIDVAKGMLPSADFARELAKVVMPLQDLVVESDGRVKTLATGGPDINAKHILHKLEGRTRTGTVELPLDAQFPNASVLNPAELPGFFAG